MAHQIAPFGLRMPDKLKAQVKALAERDGRSMNNHIIQVLQRDVENQTKKASNHLA